jgi:hypothetical protein
MLLVVDLGMVIEIDANHYCLPEEVYELTPLARREMDDVDMDKYIRAGTRQVIKASLQIWTVTEPSFPDIRIITALLTASLILEGKNKPDEALKVRSLALANLKTILDAGPDEPTPDTEASTTINVISGPKSYYSDRENIAPYRSHY